MNTISSWSKQTVEEAAALETKAKAEGKKLRVEVSDGSGFGSNSLRFDTVVECVEYAGDLFSRWMAAKEFRIAIADLESS